MSGLVVLGKRKDEKIAKADAKCVPVRLHSLQQIKLNNPVKIQNQQCLAGVMLSFCRNSNL